MSDAAPDDIRDDEPEAAPFAGKRDRFGGWPDDMRERCVTRALDIMKGDETISATKAAQMVERELGPSHRTILRWAQEAGSALSTTGFEAQRLNAARTKFYARTRRETQRMRLLDLIDQEMERTAQEFMRKNVKAKDVPNFAQRINALASAHGTIASQSRSDELHALRMGDIDPLNPKSDLDDWDGDPRNLPEGMSAKILDIDSTRERLKQLRAEQ